MTRLLTQREAAVWLSLSERTGFALLAVVLSSSRQAAGFFIEDPTQRRGSHRKCAVLQVRCSYDFKFADRAGCSYQRGT
jgi:hypothetical protein